MVNKSKSTSFGPRMALKPIPPRRMVRPSNPKWMWSLLRTSTMTHPTKLKIKIKMTSSPLKKSKKARKDFKTNSSNSPPLEAKNMSLWRQMISGNQNWKNSKTRINFILTHRQVIFLYKLKLWPESSKKMVLIWRNSKRRWRSKKTSICLKTREKRISRIWNHRLLMRKCKS